jgi:hypothetical protein
MAIVRWPSARQTARTAARACNWMMRPRADAVRRLQQADARRGDTRI